MRLAFSVAAVLFGLYQAFRGVMFQWKPARKDVWSRTGVVILFALADAVF